MRGQIEAALDTPAVARDGDGLLYWTDAGNGRINTANLDGSSPGATVTGQHDPLGVAVGPELSSSPAASSTARPPGSSAQDRERVTGSGRRRRAARTPVRDSPVTWP